MIIGVSGFSGSGKDTVADEICRDPWILGETNRGSWFVKLAMADGIKRICHDVFDWSYEQLWGPSATRNIPDKRYPREGGFLTPRFALQALGSEWGRNCYENVWVELALRLSKQLVGSSEYVYSQVRGVIPASKVGPIEPWKGVVIPDCRFKNEFSLLREAGAKLVRVKRKGLEEPPYRHPSETEQTEVPDDYFDYVFHNDGALEDVPLKIADMMKELSK